MATGDEGLNARQLEAWILLVVLLEIAPPAIERQLKADAGINLFEYTVLAMLSEEPDRMLQMARLAEVSFGSISRLSHAIDRLERRGWVEKQAGGGNRRHNTVRLTDAGWATVTEVAVGHVANVRRLLVDPLTDSEVESFVRIGRKLIGAAEPDVLDRLDRQIPEILQRNLDGSADPGPPAPPAVR
ncbi:MAG: MarR family winged helix-turn-helix transcriptional regulator [Acidimicrobiales bacterium]